ncbi:MAG: YfhO family protein, partial [Clostridia bacterium]|nr:YfhO family protein [Clostridia bacterium]
MNNMLSPQRRRITPAHAFWLGALLALCALAPAIFPYGGRFVTRGDFIEQQLPFILETRRILRTGLDAYSFSTFLGAPAMGSYAFYTLGSPFVWPLAFLPEALIPYGVSVMAILKHAVCMLCAFLYFRQMMKDERLALLGSVLYTFSSFTVVNTQFYHFTEVIAFFPLILWGLEIAMSDRPRPGLLALFCGLNALVNYYFMFSSALLAALYFVFRFFSEDWKKARTLRRVVLAVFECGVGCALSGVLLLPALWFMLSITRTGASDASLLTMTYAPAVLMERLRTLFMPIESNVVHAYYGDASSWSSTACALPALGMTGVLVFAFGQKQQRWLKALLLALLAASAVPVLCGAFALFTSVSYTRWWYGLALMLALATLYALRGVRIRRAWGIALAACAGVVLVLTVPFLLPENIVSLLPERIAGILLNRRTGAYGSDVFRLLSIVLTLVSGGVMLLLILKPMRFCAALACVSLAACVQYAGYIAVGDAHLLSGGAQPGEGVYALSDIAEPTLSALALPEPEGYARIDYSPKLRNYGLLRNQSSLTCFTSLRSSVVGRFVSMAGFGYDESTT